MNLIEQYEAECELMSLMNVKYHYSEVHKEERAMQYEKVNKLANRIHDKLNGKAFLFRDRVVIPAVINGVKEIWIFDIGDNCDFNSSRN